MNVAMIIKQWNAMWLKGFSTDLIQSVFEDTKFYF